MLEKPESKSVTRRKFLNIFMTGSISAFMVGIIYPFMRYLTPPEQEVVAVSAVNLGNESNFAANSGQIFRFGNKPGIIIRDSNGRFNAFHATCTHLDCIVQYDSTNESILCGCHNGRYDLNGKNISGPPPRPLKPMKVDILPESNEIMVSLDEGK
jgi:Rieske Fe-S protein